MDKKRSFTKNYRRALKEIIDGCSPCIVYNEHRYIKHQSIGDVVDFEDVYEKHYNKAQERGLATEEEVFAQLKKDDIWSEKDDAEIETQTFFVDSLKKNKKNIFLKSAREHVDVQIKEAQEKLSELVSQKNRLVENCCEKYAINRANDFYMISSFYKDPKLTENIYTLKEFEYMPAVDVLELVRAYNVFHEKFSETAVQHLVLQDFYRIYYAFSESSVDFFGHPIVQLTNNQLNLIIYTRVFKNIFESHDDIPEKIIKDPESLLDFANSAEAREEIKKKVSDADSAGSTIMGATKEDLAELGMEPSSAKNLQQIAKEKGGSLSMKDLMDISGV